MERDGCEAEVLLISEVPRSWPREGVSTPLQNASIFLSLSLPRPPTSLEHDGRPARNAERAVPRISKKNSPITVPWQLMFSKLLCLQTTPGVVWRAGRVLATEFSRETYNSLSLAIPGTARNGGPENVFLFNPPLSLLLRSLFLFPVRGKIRGEGGIFRTGAKMQTDYTQWDLLLEGSRLNRHFELLNECSNPSMGSLWSWLGWFHLCSKYKECSRGVVW